MFRKFDNGEDHVAKITVSNYFYQYHIKRFLKSSTNSHLQKIISGFIYFKKQTYQNVFFKKDYR